MQQLVSLLAVSFPLWISILMLQFLPADPEDKRLYRTPAKKEDEKAKAQKQNEFTAVVGYYLYVGTFAVIGSTFAGLQKGMFLLAAQAQESSFFDSRLTNTPYYYILPGLLLGIAMSWLPFSLYLRLGEPALFRKMILGLEHLRPIDERDIRVYALGLGVLCTLVNIPSYYIYSRITERRLEWSEFPSLTSKSRALDGLECLVHYPGRNSNQLFHPVLYLRFADGFDWNIGQPEDIPAVINALGRAIDQGRQVPIYYVTRLVGSQPLLNCADAKKSDELARAERANS